MFGCSSWRSPVSEKTPHTLALRHASAKICVSSPGTTDAQIDAVRTELTPHQREVFCTLALNGIPIDVLAERLDSTRGALYKTLHDARGKLRAHLGDLLEVIE